MVEYANTDTVPESGEYRCTSCGDVEEFELDDDFTLCDSCGDENASWEPTGEKKVVENPEDDGLGF